MSSPPILDLGIAGGGGAGSLRPLRQQATAIAIDQIEAPGFARIGAVATATAGEPGLASNIIELDAPLRRVAPLDRAPPSSRRRINPFAVELAIRLSDALALAATGAAAYWLQPVE